MIKVKIEDRQGPSAKARKLRSIFRTAFEQGAEYWVKHMLPQHFQPSAMSKYRYQHRSVRYAARKVREKRHDRPLVWSGDLERMVLRQAKITSDNKGASARLYGPKYLYAYRKDYKQPDKAAELTRTTEDEEQKLAWVVDRVATQQLRNS